MTIAMIISKERLEQEHAMLNRLVVGLLDDGNQVIRVVPKSETDEFSHDEHTVSFSKRVEVSMPVSRMLRKKRREEVVEIFQKNNVTTAVGFGKDAMQLALDVAKDIKLQVMCEIVLMKDVKKVKRNSQVWRWLAPTPTIEHEIAKKVGDDRVALVPFGVTDHNTTEKNENENHKCIVILNASDETKNMFKILEAFQPLQNIHLFLEMTGEKEQKIWKQLNQLEMHNRVTCLRDVGTLRQLIVHADLVILPSKSMPIRSVFLEAMLCGVPVLATPIPGFDMLIEQESAIIVNGSWKNSIASLLDDPTIGTRIGEQGSSLISLKYGSSVQIAAFEAAVTLI